MGGVDLKTVQELMGHASLEMTARYAKLSPDHKANAVQVLSRPALRVINGGRGSRTGKLVAGLDGEK